MLSQYLLVVPLYINTIFVPAKDNCSRLKLLYPLDFKEEPCHEWKDHRLLESKHSRGTLRYFFKFEKQQ
jgi:hypothetical protein